MTVGSTRNAALAAILILIALAPAAAKPVEDESAPKPEAIRLAIEDLARTHGQAYPGAEGYLDRLGRIERMPQGPDRTTALKALRREALLASPALDFDRILLIRRRDNKLKSRLIYYKRMSQDLGLPLNFNGNSDLPRDGYENQIVVLSGFRAEPTLTEIHRPDRDVLVTDVDLHWEAGKLMFSSLDETAHWHVYEIGIDGTGLRKITPDSLSELDVDSYDSCYLPDERIIFASTLTEQAVPCLGGSDMVANLCRMNPDGTGIRRLCFDQDQNWTPSVTEQGTVIFSRWQYTDQPHRYGRPVIQMNPDGTGQREFYGSNSYWPNAIFSARQIPGQPSRFVATIGGHHGVPRMGEMILFDRKLGQRQGIEPRGAYGVVQRITDRGETVKAEIGDKIVDDSWPKFVHPYPIDGKTFLVAAQPTPESHWGLYLVDVFDNMVLLHQEPGYVMFEPIPVRERPRPPVIPDRVVPGSKEATVYISDIYEGPGLAGVPRGTVKELRIFTYNYPPMFKGARGNTSTVNALGIATSWDIHAIIGRVPVQPDGSASFTVPANTPISVQPLDNEGQAMQLMRNWMTAMPGEALGCIGCHELPDEVPLTKAGLAFNRAPAKIRPVNQRVRAFDYRRDVQPVIDRRCVGCHKGPDKPGKPDLRGVFVDDSIAKGGHEWPKRSRVHPQDFYWSYYNLQRLVHRPTGEGEIAVLNPMEHHADVSELVQLIRKGHHGVKLTKDEWRAITTWIDMNAPFYGVWEDAPRVSGSCDSLDRRRELLERFANVQWDLDKLPPIEDEPVSFIRPEPVAPARSEPPKLDGWPFSAEQARQMQAAGPQGPTRTIEFGDGGKLELVWIPPGSFVMGSPAETPDERPMAAVKIEKGFWMSVTEVDNRSYRQYKPSHHSRFLTGACETLEERRMESMNADNQPVARVSWSDAMGFCEWLGEQTGQRIDLPTEAEWEWACRAGSNAGFPDWTPGGKHKGLANCAGLSLGTFHDRKSLPFRSYDARWDDGSPATQSVHANGPNVWGLKNTHGNIAEWTRSLYRAYPYNADDGREDPDAAGKRVVRGGSFSDVPRRCTASYRLGYHPWQGVYNVGFRVVIRPGRRVAGKQD